jgi:FtsP/CotA-like multicopper oxidase with cupredoxin domain
MSPGVLAVFVPLAVLLLGPPLLPWSERGAARVAGALLLVAGAVGALWLASSDGFSTRYPKPGDLFHLTDADRGRSYWANRSGLDARLDVPALAPFTGSRPWWGMPAPAADTPRPSITLTRDGSRAQLRMQADRPMASLTVALRPAGALPNATLNGRTIRVPAGEWTIIRYGNAVPPDLSLAFDGGRGGRIDLRYLSSMPGLPSGAPRAAGPPTAWTPLTGTRTVFGSARYVW